VSKKETLRLALVSLDQAWENKQANLRSCEKFSILAKQNKADVIIFPEMTLTGFSMNTQSTAEERENSGTIQELCKMAQKIELGIICGVVYKKAEKATNTLVYISSLGNVVSIYDKIHPFSFSNEDKYFIPGDKLSISKIGPFTAGFTICYDLRFAELYSRLSQECNLIINIANWPKRRVHHWQTLLRARAIENQIYMVGVNRIGSDGNGLEYEKSSYIFDANGDELEAFFSENELDIYECSLTSLVEFKAGFSTTQDRLPDLYCRL
jgi:predicted amidohydrolase